MVHFDRLKPCPPNIRLPGSTSSQPCTNSPATPATPVGTALELVDEADSDLPPASPDCDLPAPIPTPQDNTPLSINPPAPDANSPAYSPPVPRYPRRQHAEPDCLCPMIKH